MQKDGRTPLFIAAQNGYEQIVQILLEKGKPNVDLAEWVIIVIIIFNLLRMKKWIEDSYFFKKTVYLFFSFLPKKYGVTPLDTATQNGFEQVVQLLLEKGKANVNSQRKVLFLSFFFFFFLFFFFKKVIEFCFSQF